MVLDREGIHLCTLWSAEDPNPGFDRDPVKASSGVLTSIHNSLDVASGKSVHMADLAKYYFDGKGKAVRPAIVMLMGRAVYEHLLSTEPHISPDLDTVLLRCESVAAAAEMIHTASLMHDDVLDRSRLRRGRPSAHAVFGQIGAVRGGDVIVAVASRMLAELNNVDVLICMTRILDSLVTGELQQLSSSTSPTYSSTSTSPTSSSTSTLPISSSSTSTSPTCYSTSTLPISSSTSTSTSHSCYSTSNISNSTSLTSTSSSASPTSYSTFTSPTSGLFDRYLSTTFHKTASLMAYSCQAAATLVMADTNSLSRLENGLSRSEVGLGKAAFDFGRNVGMAFQLVDDWMDFAAEEEQLGKPAGVDLKLGLATAPVLFARDRLPQLETLLKRGLNGRNASPGDMAKAVEMVRNSDGMRETRMLAERYCQAAVNGLNAALDDGEAKTELIALTEKILNRTK